MLVESTLGEGSTFTVLLPLAAEAIVPPPPAQKVRPRQFAAGATVLVIDDDPAVLRVLCDTVREFGLVALAAGGVAAGRNLFFSHPEIRCVLLELTMPEGGGAPLVKEFHQLRPSAPIVLISGYAESELTSSMSGELAAFLAKPFTPMQLKEALLRVVHEGCPPSPCETGKGAGFLYPRLPQTFGTPPPPQLSWGGQTPQFIDPPQPLPARPQLKPKSAHERGVQGRFPQTPGTPPPPHDWPAGHAPHWMMLPQPSPAGPH